MKQKLNIIFVVLVLFTQCRTSKNPFYKDIQNFKKADVKEKPARDIILFIGSSSFTYWNDIKEDLHKENILNRAFGGSTLSDLLLFKKDIINKYKPGKIVIYCGENDIAGSETVSSGDVFSRFKKLYKRIRRTFPAVPLVYISLKPSPSRWKMRDRMMAANMLIAGYIKTQKNIVFINIWDKMLNNNGYPRSEIFRADSLHMNKNGYNIWIKELHAVL